MRKRNSLNLFLSLSLLLSLAVVLSPVSAQEGETPDTVPLASNGCMTMAPTIFIGDYNGDGKSDLGILREEDYSFHVSLSNGKRFGAPGSGEWLGANAFGNRNGQYYVGDYDGDLKSDLGFFNPADNSFHVNLSTGKGFGGVGSRRWTLPNNMGHSNGQFYVALFNGGRKADLGFFDRNDNSFWVGLSTGSAFNAPYSGRWVAPNTFGHAGGQYFAGDFNMDGSQDLGYFEPSNNSFHVNMSNGQSFWNSGTGQWVPPGTFGHSNGRYRVGDYSGDGRADLGFFNFGDNSFHVNLSTGAHFGGIGSGQWIPSNGFGHSGGEHFVGNFDGDATRRADLGFFQPGSNTFFVALSTGKGFSAGAQWASLDLCRFYLPVLFDNQK